MASSTYVGSPPWMERMWAYSSAVRPRATAASRLARRCSPALIGPPLRRAGCSMIDWKKTRPSVPPARPASTEFSGCGIRPNTLKSSLHTPAMSSSAPFGLEPPMVRAAALAGFAAVGGAVAQHDLAVVAQAGQRVGVDPVVALVVLDHDAQHVARLGDLGEGRAGVLDAQVDVAADELEADVADQRARQQVGLGEDLEAVADAHDQSAVGREVGDRRHDGTETGDRAAAQVVAVGEPAGDDDGLDAAQVGVFVPEPHRFGAGEGGDGVPGVVVGVDAREDADADAGGAVAVGAHGRGVVSGTGTKDEAVGLTLRRR